MYAPDALRQGFRFHHALDDKAVLTRWLDETMPNKIPPFATHQVGCAGFTTRYHPVTGRREVLLVKEARMSQRLLNEDEITSRDPRLDMHAAMMLDRMTSHAPGCELLASHPASADLLYYLIRGGMPPARRYEPCGVCCQSTCSGDPVCRM